MVDITIVKGGFKPTYNWGAPSTVSSYYIPMISHYITVFGGYKLQGDVQYLAKLVLYL
jgi:hypothetical protein